ncbi:hypothetical protein F7018_03460 [Tenacibaculum aiptasiae]|uniref:SBBP repeat-containing protein n=1 Tax=Tenacibaculum aiptasiae TaxID=426481 RepID=A0A7J5APD9_9FLAO|nr:SBBP repeat-containing protein [Tenacibaculum aiptasiae]KAB1159382.1 hypothetical protein F7018_03460 [Tenacibaculum aiptasiae]
MTKNIVLKIFTSLLLVTSQLQSQGLYRTTIFSTLYGGSGTDDADVVTVDKNGNTYLGCHTNSKTLPGYHKYPYTISGGMDALVVKLNKTGKEVEYLTKLGGSKWDAVQGIISDELGNIYAVGTTYSKDFPIKENGFQTKFGGKSDAFVLKINPKGKVIWSTFLGGKKDEDGRSISLDQNGHVYIIGRTASKNFPITSGAFQSKLAGGIDAFITKLDSNGKVLFSTYFGGSGNDIGFSIKTNDKGKLYMAGTTNSKDLPIINAIQPLNKGKDDAFVAIMNTNKSVLEFVSYFGGKDSERLYNIDIDPYENAYIMGFTNSSDYPTTKEAFQTNLAGLRDTFITKFNPNEKKLIYSTYLGGTKNENPRNFILNKNGSAIIVGYTESNNYPNHNNTSINVSGEIDAFITMLDMHGSTILFSNLFGGNGEDFFEGLSLGTDNVITVSGGSNSSNFSPKNAIQSTFKGGRFDIVVSRFLIK